MGRAPATTTTDLADAPASAANRASAESQLGFDDLVSRLCADSATVVRALAKHEDRNRLRDVVQAATEHLHKTTERGLNLSEADLSGLDLGGLDLRRANLSRARLDSTNLVGANLSGATMICPMAERTTARGACLDDVYSHALAIVSSDWSGVTMQGAIDSTGALFHGVQLTGAKLSGGNYAGTTFYQCDLTDADLRNCDLSGATFNECVMRGARLDNTQVSHLTITRSNADRLVLAGATGTGLTIQSMTGLRGIDLRDAHLPGLRIRGVSLTDALFRGASLPSFDLTDAALTNGDLTGCDLTGAAFRSVAGADNALRRAQLADASFIDCRLPGTDLCGASAENTRFLRCIMPGSQFTDVQDQGERASFTGRAMIMRDCDLTEADFTNAYLYRASFTGDPVTGMILDGAKFTRANLIQAYVAASLCHADLRRLLGAYSRFNQSDLTDADLSGASLYQSSFVKVVLTETDLRGIAPPLFTDRCRGLDTARLDDPLRTWCSDLSDTLAGRPSGST